MSVGEGNSAPNAAPLRIRAHNLLCLQGFRGLGYSPEFVARMWEVLRVLKSNPETLVQVVVGPDTFCERCPHNRDGRCTVDDSEGILEEPDTATKMDGRVLAELGIDANVVKPWSEILYIVGHCLDSSSMDSICGNCKWRPYSFCAAALDRLKVQADQENGIRPAGDT